MNKSAKKSKRVKVGDMFEIPLSDGRKSYGQYVFLDKKMGGLLQVYDLIVETDMHLESILNLLQDAKPLFPPVFVGLQAAVSMGLWTVIGHRPIEDFNYPGFILVYHDMYIPRGNWTFWDGEREIRLGTRLPDEYKDHEFNAGWSPQDVVHRIETGENPYAEMIRNG